MPTSTIDTSTGEVAAHVQLEAGTVHEVQLTSATATPGPLPALAVLEVEVVARDGAAEVFYTVDGSTPSATSKRSYVIPKGVIGSDVRVPATFRPTVVKLLALDGPARVSVQRIR